MSPKELEAAKAFCQSLQTADNLREESHYFLEQCMKALPALLAHIRQQTQEIEGEKRASKIYREEAEGYRRENEKLKAAYKQLFCDTHIVNSIGTPAVSDKSVEDYAEEALSALVGEARPIFQPGDSQALEKVAFDFEHLARDGGMAELFIEHHCEVLRRLAEVAKGGQP